jgi:hypothetical protein
MALWRSKIFFCEKIVLSISLDEASISDEASAAERKISVLR